MRILLLTQWFDPEPASKGLSFARALADRGHDVEVLTGFPNYPGGKVYPGYRVRPLQRERMQGIDVVRVPLYPSHDGSSLRRAANYATFGLSAATIGAACVRRPDVVYLYHPPPTAGFAALALRAVYGCPFVYDIQDLWPDSVASSGMISSGAVHRALDAWCRVLYRAAGRIVVLSPGFKDALCQRGVPEHKIDVIYNWAHEQALDCPRLSEAEASRLGLSGRFNVVFAGTMGKVQALDAVLEAARLVAGRLPSVQFLLVGGGIEVERLRARAAEMNLANVRFLPRMPVSEIGGLLRLADALLVHLADEPLFRITIPSKTQAYMAAGRPILLGVKGDAAALVRQARCGLVCEPGSPESLAAGVERLSLLSPQSRDLLGQNGKRFYREHLCLDAAVRKFERVFHDAVRGTTSRDRADNRELARETWRG